MGTNRSEIYRKPCRCGKGEFIIICCTRDNSWSTLVEYEKSISCNECKNKYSLEEQDDQIILVRNSDIKEREKYADAQWNRAESLMNQAKVKYWFGQFETHLSQLPSITAIYRLLKSLGLTRYASSGGFRHNWSNSSEWIGKNISLNRLSEVMNFLKVKDPQIEREIIKIENLWRKSQRPLSLVGDPLIKPHRN